jgi:LysM repeat protein
MFVDDLFDKKSLTESQGGGSPWHSEPEQQQMDADRRGRLGRERNAGLDEPDDAASGSVQTGNGVYEYTVPAGQESLAQELGLQQHRGHWVSRVPIQRANFQFGQPQFHEIPAQGVAESDPKDRQWSKKDMERLRVGIRDFDDIMASDGPDQTKHDLIKKRIQTKPMAGPKGVLPEQGVEEGMLDNPGQEDSPVAQAIIRRILMQRTDLLAKHGPEKVGAAVDEVADFVGDVDEIGSSDVSGWIRQVERTLGNMEKGIAESRSTKQSHKTKRDRLVESYVLKDPLYEQWRGVSRIIAERKMSEKEILQVFADAEAGMTNKGTGANRTMLGRGKDTTMAFAGNVKDAVTNVLSSIQNSVPVSAVDVAYDQATDAVAGLAGGQRGKVMQAIKGYRNLVKEYPKAAGFAKAALVAIAGLATGGASLPAIAGLTYALDSAIRGDKLSSVIGKGMGASAVTWGAQQVAGALGGLGADPTGTGGQTISAEELKSMGMQQRPDGTWGVAVGDTLPNGATVIEIHPDYIVSELRPVDTASSLSPGESIVNTDTPLPQGATVRCPLGSCNGDVWQVKPGETLNDIAQQIGVPPQELAQLNPGLGGPGGTYTVVKGDQLGYIAQAQGTTPEAIRAANPDINFAKALKPGTELNLPDGTPGQGSVWTDYKGGMYGDKVAGQTAGISQAGYSASPAGPTNLGPNFDPNNIPPGWTMKRAPSPIDEVRESILPAVKLLQLPAEKLIDKQGTIMSWALQESIGVKRKSVNLTTTGAYTVFENIDRYRQAIMEKAGVPGSTRPAYYRPDMPDAPVKKSKPGIIGKGLNWLDKTAGKVGSALGNFGHQFTTNVTKEKLKMNWHQAGKPSESDQLAAFLSKQGVPQEVVTTVYGKMGIPYTAPVVEPKAQPATDSSKVGVQTGAIALIDPDTKKPYEKDKLAAMYGYKEPAEKPEETPPAPAAQTPAATITNPAGFNAGNVMKLPGMEKYAKPTTAVAPKTANFGAGPTGYAKTTTSIKPPAAPSSPALAAPSAPKVPRVTAGGPTPAEKANLEKRIAAAAPAVAETLQQIDRMLESVNSKKSAEIVKAYADQQFTKLGLRNTTECKQIMAHVVHESAVRRRAYAQLMAK